jgi:gamma-glutamyltranspeptidase/glutathione hydrolase
VISARQANSLNAIQVDLQKNNSFLPVFFRVDPWKQGDTLVQKDLAATLKRIRDKGAAGFYEGETARLIVEEMQRGKGIITLNDLKTYTARSRRAYQFSYKGYDVVTMPLSSSGGIMLHQMMKMIEGYNIGAMGFHSAESVQLMAEVEKRSYADRGEYLGDADFYPVPVKMITQEKYLQEKMKNYKPGYATPSAEIKPGVLIRAESVETTHFNVIDKEGNAVAVTTTLNNSYGSKTVIGNAGFFINDEMDDFSIKPGVPNMYGAIGGAANAIAPGKRMLSSMTPTIVLKNSRPYIVTGTPGGTTIQTSVFQTLLNLIDFKLSPEMAINAPKFHHQWLPDELQLEKGFPEDVKNKLEAMGYKIKMAGGIGRTELILALPNGIYKLVADQRGEDDARGY